MLEQRRLVISALFVLCLGGCTSTETPEPESTENTYGKTMGKKAKKMVKNIGNRGMTRALNKAGNKAFNKIGI